MAVQISGNDITVPRDGSFTRNVTIGGTLTYEDVTNIDSVGLITARNGIEIGARPGVAASISVDGNMIVSGISTLGGAVSTGALTVTGATNVNAGHVNVDAGYSFQWDDSHERIEQSDGNIEFFTGNGEKMRLSGSNLGIGTAAPTHNLDIHASGNPYLKLLRSGYSPVYIGNAAGEGVIETTGATFFKTNSQERLRIDSSGRLLLNATVEGNAGADDFTLGQLTGSTGITIRSGTTNNGNLYFSDGTSGDDECRGSIQYQHANDSLHIATNSVEAMVIKSNQSICMGGTLQAGANGGVNIESTSSGNKPVGLSLINQGTADDTGFTLSYRGKDAAGNQEDFAYLKFTAQDTANGAEDGNLEIWTAKGGTLTKSVQIGPGKPNGEPAMFVIMDSNASGANSEECLRLTNLSDTAYNWCTVSFAVNNSVQWKVGAQRHGAGGGADLLFINNGNDRFRIYENGKLRSQQTYSGTTTGGGPVYVESDGDLLRYTSSRKYKTDIETLEDARADKILDCRPVWYRSLSENDIKTPGSDKSDWGWYGFIAEEVAEIEPRLVNWATKDAGTNPDDGFASVERDPSNYTAEGVRYDNFVPLLVNLVKRQKAEIESLKARLDAAGL